jgi:hypothetical protein
MKFIIVLFLMIMTQTTTAGVIGQGGGGGPSRLSDFTRNNSFDGTGGPFDNNKLAIFGIRGTLGGDIEHIYNPKKRELHFKSLMMDRGEVHYDRLSAGSNWSR